MKHFFEFIALAALALPLALLPKWLSIRTGKLIGLLYYYLLPSRRRVVINNISSAHEGGFYIAPDKSPALIARECYMHFGRVIAEISKVAYGITGSLVRSVRLEGMEHLERASAGGKGYIAVTGHFGNWEVGGMVFPSMFNIKTAVVRRQKNPYLDRVIVRYRTSMGATPVYKEGAVREFIKALSRGEGVFVAMDEAKGPDKGVPVSFLGNNVGLPKIVHSLSKKHGAPVLPVIFQSEGDGYVIRVYPELEMSGDEIADTQMIATFFEQYISDHPEQWLQWLRRWDWKNPPRRKKQ